MPSGVMASGVMPMVSGGTQAAAAAIAPALGESAAKASIFGFDPASILFSLFASQILGKKSIFDGMPVTEMTPELLNKQALDYFNQQQMNIPEGGTEGQAETLFDIIAQADALGNTETAAKARDAAETLGILKAFPAAQDYNPDAVVPADTSSSSSASNSAMENVFLDPNASTIENTIDNTIDNTNAGGSEAAVVQEGSGSQVDANETYTYDAGKNVFVSDRTGEAFPAGDTNDVNIQDGGTYAVRPVLGQDGTVIAEHVVDASGQSVAEVKNVDGKAVLGAILDAVNVFDTKDKVAGTGDTTTTGDSTVTGGGDSTVTGGGDATVTGGGDSTVTGGGDATVITVGGGTGTTKTTDTTVTDSNDGTVGDTGGGVYDFFDFGNDTGTTLRGGGGGSQKGMMASIINQTPMTDSLLVKPMMRELNNIPVGLFEQFMRASGGR